MDTCIDNQTVLCENDNRSDKAFPMLIELVQNQSKLKIRNDLLHQLCECEKKHGHNKNERIDYDFSTVFENVLLENGANFKIQDINLYDYILFEPQEYMDNGYEFYNTLTLFCIKGYHCQCWDVLRDPEEYQSELFMQFMTFIKSFNLQITIDIIKTYCSYIRNMIMKDKFEIKHIEVLLTWDKKLLEVLFYWDCDRNTKNYINLPFIFSRSGDGLKKIKLIVTFFDDQYQQWTPLAQLTSRAHNNIVQNIIFYESNSNNDTNDYFALEDVLLWVVNSFPGALRNDSYPIKRQNAFATVIDHFNCPLKIEHEKIIQEIMQHASIEDNICGAEGMTLIQYAEHKKNNLVLNFLTQHFHIFEGKVGIE